MTLDGAEDPGEAAGVICDGSVRGKDEVIGFPFVKDIFWFVEKFEVVEQ